MRAICFGALLICGPALASGISQLQAFLESTKSASGSFQQTVTGKTGRPSQSGGTFEFSRPGKFRWTYDRPYEQLIVGDGTKVWIFDRDLNQVVVRKLDAALGSTPAALLAGDNALEANFTLTNGGEGNGIEYVNALPKSAESQFSRVRLGFKDNLPRSMELSDAFGGTTLLLFGTVERNPKIAADRFKFTPPPNADVVGDVK